MNRTLSPKGIFVLLTIFFQLNLAQAGTVTGEDSYIVRCGLGIDYLGFCEDQKVNSDYSVYHEPPAWKVAEARAESAAKKECGKGTLGKVIKIESRCTRSYPIGFGNGGFIDQAKLSPINKQKHEQYITDLLKRGFIVRDAVSNYGLKFTVTESVEYDCKATFEAECN